MDFTISRTFDVTADTMFRTWTECERLTQWWGPKGATVRVCKIDPQPGGTFLYCLRMPNGQELWGRFLYREVVRPDRLVFVNSFSDEQGNITRHPWNESWPLQLLSIITFAQDGGKTTVHVKWTPLNPTEAEKKTFNDGQASMQQGWTGTMDQLGEYLSKT